MRLFPDSVDANANSAAGGPLSRRRLLTLAAAASTLAVGGGAVASCSKKGAAGGGSGPVDVTLKVSDWPYPLLPSAKVQKADPVQKAYAEVLTDWLDKNPGVTLKQVKTDVWDQESLNTAVSGGSAPAFFPGNVLGGWDNSATKLAFVQGLAADVTDLLDTYKINDKVAGNIRPIWKTWRTNGRYYGIPSSFNVGNGIYFRRDLIRAEGLEEPTPGWTWDDARTLAKGLTKGPRKGFALQPWGMSWALGAEGFALLSELPAPDTSWNWKWDFTSRSDEWVRVIENFRAMIFEDMSVLSEISFGDAEVTQAFSQGRAAMMPNNAGFFLGDPDTANTPANLAKKLGKDVGDVYGWVQHPVGRHGLFGNTAAFTVVLSLDPDLDGDAIDKAVGLADWMTFGAAYTRQKQAIWESSKELKKVYTDATPINGLEKIEGVPGTVEDAWGAAYMQAVRTANKIPLVPNTSDFLPVEENAGPSDTATDDAVSKWTYERTQPDVPAGLKKTQDTRNKQAEGFTSSVPDEEFVAAAKKYFDAQADFWKQHAPDFYADVFQGWYDGEITPALT